MQRQLTLLIWGGQLTVDAEAIDTVDHHRENQHEKAIASFDPGGSTINAERINNQLSCEKAIASVDPWGINDQHREDQQSTFTWNGKFKRFN